MRNLKIIYNKCIPFNGYYAITLFDYMIIRCEFKGKPLNDKALNHERIHQAQSRDFMLGWCGYFIFYLLYLLEWFLKLPCALFGYLPYKSISFEQEAYNNEKDYVYLRNRKRFSWIKYIFKMVKKK